MAEEFEHKVQSLLNTWPSGVCPSIPRPLKYGCLFLRLVTEAGLLSVAL